MFTVDRPSGSTEKVTVNCQVPVEYGWDRSKRGFFLILPSMETAEALRDALTNFIHAHKPRPTIAELEQILGSAVQSGTMDDELRKVRR